MKTNGLDRTTGKPPVPESRGLAALDRLLGDALIAAMILLGFAFCLGAARAGEPCAAAFAHQPVGFALHAPVPNG